MSEGSLTDNGSQGQDMGLSVPRSERSVLTPSFRTVLGMRLRKLRHERRLLQEEVAERVRGFGLSWDRSTVASIETGRRGLSLEDALLVAVALNAPVSQLLRGAGEVQISRTGSMDIADVATLLNGGRVSPSAVRSTARQYGTGSAPTEAERKAARRLGVPPSDVAAASFALWGTSLTVERDRRAKLAAPPGTPGRSLQGFRNHATRALLSELASHLGVELAA